MRHGRDICRMLLLFALLATAGSCRRGETGGTAVKDIDNIDTLFKRGDDSLLAERNAFALEAIRRGREIARDSDEYYMMEVLRSKYYFLKTDADSFLTVNNRLAAYLRRNAGEPNRRRWALAVYERLQRASYLSRMAGKPDSALACNISALQMMEQGSFDRNAKVKALCNTADNYKQLGRYAECIYYYKWGLGCADSTGMTDRARIMLTLGISSAYTAMHEFSQSREWWEKARRLYPRMGFKDKFIYLNNRGNDYYLQQEYDDSRKCFEALDTLLGGRRDYEWERMFGHANLADVYLKLGETEKARRLIAEVEPFFRENDFRPALFYLDTQKIELLMRAGDTAGAMRIAGDGGIPEGTMPEQEMMRLAALEKLYEATGDMPDYIRVSRKRHALGDSLASDNLKMRFSEQLMRYERDVRLLEQQRTIAEKETAIGIAVGLLIGVVVIAILIITVSVLHRHRLKLREAELRNEIVSLRIKNTRNLISPHFIYNALSHEMLAQMEGRSVNLDMLVQLLRRGNQMADVMCTTLREELEFIDYYVAIESRSVEGGIVFEKNIGGGIDTSAVCLPSMMIHIFVENAIKHGLKRGKAGADGRRLWIDVERKGEGTLVRVTDNGGGAAECRCGAGGYGTGMTVVSRTVELLNGRNRRKMEFGAGRTTLGGGAAGYSSWLYLPDGFRCE